MPLLESSWLFADLLVSLYTSDQRQGYKLPLEGKCVFVLVQLEGTEDAGTCENQGNTIEKWINKLEQTKSSRTK